MATQLWFLLVLTLIEQTNILVRNRNAVWKMHLKTECGNSATNSKYSFEEMPLYFFIRIYEVLHICKRQYIYGNIGLNAARLCAILTFVSHYSYPKINRGHQSKVQGPNSSSSDSFPARELVFCNSIISLIPFITTHHQNTKFKDFMHMIF